MKLLSIGAALFVAGNRLAYGADVISQGDQARARFEYAQAISHYAKEPATRDTRLKLAGAYFWHAVEREGDEQERLLTQCIGILDKLATELATAQGQERKLAARVHAELGRANGQLALHRGGKGKVELGKKVKAEADQALALDPDNAQAHAVLGKWHYELAGLSGLERMFGRLLFGKIPDGSYATAVRELRVATSLDPRVPFFRLALAEALVEVEDKDGAEDQLRQLVRLKPLEGPDRGYIKQGEGMLRDLED